jgi:hypothetical protein
MRRAKNSRQNGNGSWSKSKPVIPWRERVASEDRIVSPTFCQRCHIQNQAWQLNRNYLPCRQFHSGNFAS